jgi:hypothetical protein
LVGRYFSKDGGVAVLTKSGRSAIASSIKSQMVHLAWGDGLETWASELPPEDVIATGLAHEIGRRRADEILFVEGDDDGPLITPTGRFSAVNYPMNNLFMRFTFDFEDAANRTIRELGVFIDTITNPELPAGQRYFELADVVEPGILLVLEHTVPLIRTAATRESFSFVITF